MIYHNIISYDILYHYWPRLAGLAALPAKDHYHLLQCSPHSKKICVRQIVLDKWLREMGGAPRNPAPRNHFLVGIAKPSGCHCTDTLGGKQYRRVPTPLRSTSPFSDSRKLQTSEGTARAKLGAVWACGRARTYSGASAVCMYIYIYIYVYKHIYIYIYYVCTTTYDLHIYIYI